MGGGKHSLFTLCAIFDSIRNSTQRERTWDACAGWAWGSVMVGDREIHFAGGRHYGGLEKRRFLREVHGEWGEGFGSDVPSRCPPRGRDSFSRMRGGAGEPLVIDGGPTPLNPPRDWESHCRLRGGIFVSSKKVGAEQESGACAESQGGDNSYGCLPMAH